MSPDDKKRSIGKVISVSADRLTVEMHGGTDNFTVVGFDGIHYVARLGSYLVVPVQSAYLVAEVTGLRERDASFDGGSLDKAASAKYLDLVPVGMLPFDGGERFRFGVSTFPALYADALYALDAELDRIFDTANATELAPDDELGPREPLGATRYSALSIGQSAVFQGYDVKVRVDDLFGGHAAVLGNTGSGKSCTISSILQSLFEKPDEYAARGSTFVILDVNGEYFRALAPLDSEGQIRVRNIVLDGTANVGKFRLPHWFLDQSEWELLLQASERTQVPVLRAALGLTSLFSDEASDALRSLKNHILATCIGHILADESGSPSKRDRITGILARFNTPEINRQFINPYTVINYGEMKHAPELIEYLLGGQNGGGFLIDGVQIPEYSGLPFDFESLGPALDLAILYEEAHGNRHIRDYCSQLITRFKSLRERSDYAFLRANKQGAGVAVAPEAFLAEILGLQKNTRGNYIKSHQIIILDMNSVEDEVVELVSAIVGRMVFRLLRQSDPRNRFPVHLLLEEAHRYISASPSRYSLDAGRIFERIAKEGRKYGLFIVLASQRPSELSKTVLSQCSNFIVHRIQNPDDLNQIRQMTPFISDNVLRRLPSLPKQHALVFGTSVHLPTTFKVRDANPLPKSDDARIRELWFHEAGQTIEALRHLGDPPQAS